MLERARLFPEPLREQRLLEHFQRQTRREFADFDHRAVAPAGQAFNRRPPDPVDGGSEFRDLPGRKQRRERTALDAPVLALGCQHAVAESGAQDAELQFVLAIV